MRLLTEKEAAYELRLSCQTLRNWRVQGRGPRFKKFGKRVVYEGQDIDDWVAEQSRNNTSEGGDP